MKRLCKRLVAAALATLMLLSLCGCGSITDKAEASVSGMFDAFKALDFEKARDYVDVDSMKLSEYDTNEDADYERFMSTLFDRLDYKIVSSEELDDETVNVVVEITAVDMKAVLKDYVAEALKYAFSNTLEDPQPTEEETQKKMEDLFIASATKEGLDTVTSVVTIKVVNDDGNWKIVSDDPLVDALFGGLISAIEEISESFGG